MSKNNVAGGLQNVVDGNPILPGGLHAHIFAVVFAKPRGTPPEGPVKMENRLLL